MPCAVIAVLESTFPSTYEGCGRIPRHVSFEFDGADQRLRMLGLTYDIPLTFRWHHGELAPSRPEHTSVERGLYKLLVDRCKVLTKLLNETKRCPFRTRNGQEVERFHQATVHNGRVRFVFDRIASMDPDFVVVVRHCKANEMLVKFSSESSRLEESTYRWERKRSIVEGPVSTSQQCSGAFCFANNKWKPACFYGREVVEHLVILFATELSERIQQSKLLLRACRIVEPNRQIRLDHSRSEPRKLRHSIAIPSFAPYTKQRGLRSRGPNVIGARCHHGTKGCSEALLVLYRKREAQIGEGFIALVSRHSIIRWLKVARVREPLELLFLLYIAPKWVLSIAEKPARRMAVLKFDCS